jgi:hypothetical protein
MANNPRDPGSSRCHPSGGDVLRQFLIYGDSSKATNTPGLPASIAPRTRNCGAINVFRTPAWHRTPACHRTPADSVSQSATRRADQASCDEIFIEKGSGKLARRPELDEPLPKPNRAGD